MTSTFEYPGRSILDKVRNEVDNIGTLDLDATTAAIASLNDACAAGLSLEQTREATVLFFAIIGQVLEDADNIQLIDTHWLERVVHELDSSWLARVPLLEAEDQYHAHDIVDRTFFCWIRRRGDAVALKRGMLLLQKSPIPACFVANTLLTIGYSGGVPTPLDLHCASLVRRYGYNVEALLNVAFLSSHIEFQYAEACSHHSGKELAALQEMWEFHKHLTQVFDAEFFAHIIGFFGSHEKKMEALQQAVEMKKQLLSASLNRPRDPFADGFSEYLQARIDAGCNEVKAARKRFRKLLESGFALYETACSLATIHHVLNDPDDARQVLEETAYRIPVLKGNISPNNSFGELYAQAGGSPSSLGHAEPPPQLLAQRDTNEKRRREDFLPQLAAQQSAALAEFWAAREKAFQQYIASTFHASHYDAALGMSEAPIEISLDPKALGGFCIDEIPVLSMLDRSVLIEASKQPTDARVVTHEVLKYLDYLKTQGRTFDDLTRAFPGYGHSRAVFHREIAPHLEAGNANEIERLLDLAEGLKGMPDASLSFLFAECGKTLFKGAGWKLAIERTRRLAERLKEPDARNAVVEVLRTEGFEILSDPSRSDAWIRLVESLLDLADDPTTSERLLERLEARFQAGSFLDVDLQTGELLSGRLPGDLATRARSATRAALHYRLSEANAEQGKGFCQRLLKLCANDASVFDELSGWYTRRFPVKSTPEPAIALGEWLLGQLPEGEAREQIRLAVRDMLMDQLATTEDEDAARSFITRAIKIGGKEESVQDGIADWYERWQRDGEDRAAFGEWLLSQLDGPAAKRVQGTCRAALESLLNVAQGRNQRITLLGRLVAICPDDGELEERLASARKEQKMFRLKVASIAVGLVGIGILILNLLR